VHIVARIYYRRKLPDPEGMNESNCGNIDYKFYAESVYAFNYTLTTLSL